MGRVLPYPAKAEPVERYTDIPARERLRFEAICAKHAQVRSVFAARFTTPAKLADAKRLLVEIERDTRLLREAL